MSKANHSRDARDVKDKLNADGWILVRTKGSHAHYKHPTKKGRVTLVTTQTAIPTGTLKDIYDSAGWQW